MTPDTFKRSGAVALILSGAALGYSYVSHPHHMSPDIIASPSWAVIHALFALSLVLGLMGTIAVYAPGAIRAGGLGLAGIATLFVGMMMIFGLDYYEVFIAPYLARHYPQVILDHGAGDAMGPVAWAFPLAGVLTVLGYAMLGGAWLRAGLMARPVAIALILTALAFGVGLSPVGGILTAQITAAAFGIALMAVGASTWRATAA